MQQQASYKELLLGILKIIDYQNNKEKFITEFEMLNQLDAMVSIIDSYPVGLQEKVKSCKTPGEINQYISADAYKDVYIKVSQKALQDFLKAIANTLSTSQKQQLINLVSLQ